MTAKPPGKEKLRAPLKGTPKTIKPPSHRLLYLVMALVAVVILGGGYSFYNLQEQEMRQRINDGLSVVAQLKSEQIAEWRTERLMDANMLVESPFFTEGVERFLASPTDAEPKNKLLARLAIIAKYYPYQDILLVDLNGNVLLSLNESIHRISAVTLTQLPVAVKEHKADIVDFHYLPDSNSPHLDVVAPLFPWGQDSQQSIGAIVFSIDPSQYLYPLLQSWPVQSDTAETLLVERDGDQVLYLNELRHQKDTTLKLRIPLSRQEVPAVMAVTGKEGIVEGRDYRGVEVLSALKHIPDSPWYMVAKIDTSEALSVWRSRAGMIIAFFAGLLAAAIAGIGFIWQRRERLAYQTLYQTELGGRALRSHFEYLVKYANDIIILVDEDQHIVEANDRALKAYGYKLEEMLGMPLAALISAGDLSSHQTRLRKIQQEGTIVAEAIHQRKDGSTFPVEVSGRAIKIEDKVYLQEIIRDITERRLAEEALRQSEEKYRDLVETVPDVVFAVDENGTLTYLSPAIEPMTGYSISELMGRTFADFLYPEDLAHALETFQRTLSGEISVNEVRFFTKSGEMRWLSYSDKPIFVGDRVVGVHGIFSDITERKLAEETLRQSEERYRTILEEMDESYYEVDLAGNFTFVNDALCRSLGHSREDLIGINYKAYTPKDRTDSTFKVFNQVFRTGQPLEGMPAIVIARDGTQRFIERSIFPIRNEEGKIIGFRGITRDLTERKRSEEAVEQSEEKYRTVLNEIYEVYYEVALNGNYTFFNDALCRRMGYSREELMGMNYRVYTPKEDWKSDAAKFRSVYQTGEPLRWVPLRNITRDGKILYLEDTVLPLHNEKGEVIGFRGLSRDVTERRKAEEERRQLEVKAQITSRLASVGEMAAGVAHEINNPLTGVAGYAQLLMERKDVPPDIRSDLAAINDGAQRVAGIVQRLLAFSRQTKPQRKLVDINQLIESTLILRAYHLKVNNIKVEIRLDRYFPETVADPGQIQQVLLNLIVNAETEMKLAHGKGKLTITTKKSDNIIKICVKDNGPGIKPDVMDRIFDPFFTTREVGQGTGLGLSLCYGIVAEHNGRIYAESQPGKGATFIMELPVVSEVEPPKPAEPVIKKSQKSAKARILVVDDEQVVRDVISRALTGEGHKVETADNAADALKKIESKRYDLILLDIKMPGVSGMELYKRIQKINKALARKVVFITGDIMGHDTERFLAETKSAHIEKPFDAERLSREVNRALTTGR